MKSWDDLFLSNTDDCVNFQDPRKELDFVLARLFDMILPFGVMDSVF